MDNELKKNDHHKEEKTMDAATTLNKLILLGNTTPFSSGAEFKSGYVAACTSIIILFPLNKLIFRQILDGLSFSQALTQLKGEGFLRIYRGLLPPLLQKSTSYSIMFGTQHEYYMRLRTVVDNSNWAMFKSMSPASKRELLTGVSGALAGLTEALLTPFERVQALLQMQQFHHRYRHTWHVFNDVARAYGLKELYRGYTTICLRNSLSNVIFFTSRKDIKHMFPKTSSPYRNAVYDFLTGGLLGSIISTIFYPLNVLKSHMQARIGGNYLTLNAAFWMIYESRERQMSFLYKGVGSNFLRAVLAWGITNSSYELFLHAFKTDED